MAGSGNNWDELWAAAEKSGNERLLHTLNVMGEWWNGGLAQLIHNKGNRASWFMEDFIDEMSSLGTKEAKAAMNHVREVKEALDEFEGEHDLKREHRAVYKFTENNDELLEDDESFYGGNDDKIVDQLHSKYAAKKATSEPPETEEVEQEIKPTSAKKDPAKKSKVVFKVTQDKENNLWEVYRGEERVFASPDKDAAMATMRMRQKQETNSVIRESGVEKYLYTEASVIKVILTDRQASDKEHSIVQTEDGKLHEVENYDIVNDDRFLG